MSFVHRLGELVENAGIGLTYKAPHWERVPLGVIADVINGFPFPSSEFNNEKVGEAVIRIRDVTSGEASTYFKGNVNNAPRVGHGDLVIGMDGDFNSRLWLGDSVLMNQRVCKVVPDERFYSKALLAYVLPGYLKLINDHTSAITVKHLSSRTVQEIPLPLPPRAEQDRLASKIDELFSRIDEGDRALDRVSKLVERYRQSVLKAAVTGELTRDWRKARKAAGQPVESGEALLTRILTARREAWEQAELAKMQAKGIKPVNDGWKKKYKEPSLPQTSDLPQLPEGWVWASLPLLCGIDSTNGISVKGLNSPPGVPALRLDAMGSSGFDYSARRYIPISQEKARRLYIRAGDFFVSRANGSLALVGRAVLAQEITDQVVFPDTMIRYRLVDAPDCRAWLARIWASRFIRDQLERKAKTTAGIYKISQEDISQIAIPLPPLGEQEVALSSVDERLSQAEEMTANARLGEKGAGVLRQAILKQAFSGRLAPQNSEDEPASVLLARIAAEHASIDTAPPKRGRKMKPA